MEARRVTTALRFRDRAEFLRGREAEQTVAALLKDRGWYVIPSYDYSGPDGERAPKMQGAQDGVVLPDLDIAKRGSRRKWAEVKAKAAPSWTCLTQTMDHGIGYRKWCHYRRIESETGCEVWLFIIEEDTQLLLVESLDVLGPGRRYTGDLMDRGGMVFWPRQTFNCRLALNSIPGLLETRAALNFEK
jgi:hypothetical protein